MTFCHISTIFLFLLIAVLNIQQYFYYSYLIYKRMKGQEQSPLLDSFVQVILQASRKISKRAYEFARQFTDSSSHNEKPLRFVEWAYPITNPTASPICSKSFSKSLNKRVFRCFDCLQLDTALLCYDCFVNSNHKGHTFRQFQSQGGCCDCGDSQLWNENGFCPVHSKKTNEIKIDEQMRVLFIKELTFVYYIYFWMVHNISSYPILQKRYGQILFQFINRMTEYNFETKILIAQLMSSSFDGYPPLPTLKNTIISSIFNLNQNLGELQNFQKFAFDLYSVEASKECILIEYFKLMARNGLTDNHPLRKMNFQYLTCSITINRLISNNKMLPLHINPNLQNFSSATIQSIFRQYYQDMNYLRKTKGSKQYYVSHFTLLNAVEMAAYRRYSRVSKLQKVYLDEFYLKVLGAGIRFILDRKDLIAQSIKDLLSFIVGFNEQTYSLAQERAFAMFTMAYLDGQLQKLLLPEIRESFLSTFQLQSPEILKRLIVKGLTDIASLSLDPIKLQKSDYQKFYMSVFTEKHFEQQLDLIYHKMLMMLSRDRLNYWEIVESTALHLSSLEKGRQLISSLSLFLCRMFTQELNEITVCNNMGIVHKQQIFQLYRRIIAVYGDKFQVKQLKALASYFINNNELFEEVLSKDTTYDKRKIILINPVDPLDKLIYYNMLKTIKFSEDLIWLKGKIYPIKYLTVFEVFSQHLIDILINNAIGLINVIKSDPKKDNQAILQRQIMAILQILLIKNNEQIKIFLKASLQKIKSHININIVHLVNSICKEKDQLLGELKQEQKDKQEQQKKKRQKIESKRRQKQAAMKKNQQLLLKQYNFNEELSQIQTCIYCREDITHNSYLIAFIGLSNIVSKKIIHQNSIHLFVTTCGHKIHQHCYSKSAGQGHQSKCFLCKKQTNILIPKISHQTQPEASKRMAYTFLDSIYAILLSQSDQSNLQMIHQFYDVQNKGSMINAFLTSIAKEAIFYGIHHLQSFKKYSLPAYEQIYQALKTVDKQSIRVALAQVRQEQTKDSHLLTLLQNYALQLLQKELLKQQNMPQTSIQLSLTQPLARVITLICDPKSKEAQIKQVSIVNKNQLFNIMLPECINELHHLIGQCSFCGKFTNWIYYCMLCDWKACNKQANHFHKHSTQAHLEGSIFICPSNGRYSIIYNGNVNNQDSIYENAYGQPYTHSQQSSKKNYLLSFHLNTNKYEKLFRDVISHNIHNLLK